MDRNKREHLIRMMKKGQILTQSFCKFRSVCISVLKYRTLDHVRDWGLLFCIYKKDGPIPEGVLRGHLEAYVGKEFKRFVIKITLLNHPHFQALLDHAEEAFEFTTGSRHCIPCSETMFLIILQYVTSQQDQKCSLFF